MELLRGMACASVDVVVTSPPYFAQREYGEDDREVGREDDPREYISRLVSITSELIRIVGRDGHVFVNMGDKYNADGPVKPAITPAGYPRARRQPRWPGMSLKSLMMLPHRYAIACADDLGLAVRAEIVWHKGAGGSDGKARDRVRRSHEHIYHLTRRLKHGESSPVFAPPGQSVWSIHPKNGSDTGFPERIPSLIIASWCPQGGVVLDPFMGSGTTLVAAKRAGMRSIGIDIEQRCCASSVARLSALS
jgi:DNA modification methylase